jgi:hypothetical protein
MPTRRKQSLDIKSTCTQASYKETSQEQLQSTSHHTTSQQEAPDTLTEEHTFADNSFSDSCFDSLDLYHHQPPRTGILEKLVCLQKMFSEIKCLRGLERSKQGQKELSVIENSLLSLER